MCGMKILSETISDMGYGNSLQSVQGDTQLSRKLITQESGLPGDTGLWESHSGRVEGFTNTRLCGESGEVGDRICTVQTVHQHCTPVGPPSLHVEGL